MTTMIKRSCDPLTLLSNYKTNILGIQELMVKNRLFKFTLKNNYVDLKNKK